MVVEPNYAVATGEFIAEWLADHGVGETELARRLEISPVSLRELLDGNAPLTPALAERLESVTEIPARSWTKLEALYRKDLQRLCKKSSAPNAAPHYGKPRSGDFHR